MLPCTLAGLVVCTGSNAFSNATSESPYQGIVERNVFGLKAPPPPPDPEASKPPPPKIFLTGITTILGSKRALMKLTPPAKPGEPAKEQSFTLAEKQGEGGLEVLEIDEIAGTVKVNEFGTIITLSFENNGVKAPATPGMPGAPNPAGFPPGVNPGLPGGGVMPVARPIRLPPAGAAMTPAFGGATPVYASGGSSYAGANTTSSGYGGGIPISSGAAAGLALGGTSVPLTGSTSSQSQSQAAESPTSQLPAEQQFLLVEAERARLLRQQQQGANLNFPPIPPTPLTSQLNPGATGDTTPPAPTTPTTPVMPTLPLPPGRAQHFPHP